MLATSAPIEDTDKAMIFAVTSAPAIDVGKLAYFAISVFWRASIHRWNLQDHSLGDIDLGKYNEVFRQFLLGTTKFPDDAAILIDIFGFRSPVLASMLFPYWRKARELSPLQVYDPWCGLQSICRSVDPFKAAGLLCTAFRHGRSCFVKEGHRHSGRFQEALRIATASQTLSEPALASSRHRA